MTDITKKNSMKKFTFRGKNLEDLLALTKVTDIRVLKQTENMIIFKINHEHLLLKIIIRILIYSFFLLLQSINTKSSKINR
jgi:hypothetical protein